MASIAQIRANANLIPDEELRDVCVRIIEQVEKRLNRPNKGFWTIDVISRWVDRAPDDVKLNRSIQLLASRMDAKLFEMHFIFFDTRASDGGEFVDDDDVIDAFKDGFFVHPRSGEEIADFQEYLLPYFVPAQDLVAQ